MQLDKLAYEIRVSRTQMGIQNTEFCLCNYRLYLKQLRKKLLNTNIEDTGCLEAIRQEVAEVTRQREQLLDIETDLKIELAGLKGIENDG